MIRPMCSRLADFRPQEGRGKGRECAEGEKILWPNDVSKALTAHSQGRRCVPPGEESLPGITESAANFLTFGSGALFQSCRVSSLRVRWRVSTVCAPLTSPPPYFPQALRTPNAEGMHWQKASLRTGESLDNLRELLKKAGGKVRLRLTPLVQPHPRF